MTWNIWTDITNIFTGGFTQASFDQLISDIVSDVEVAEADLAKAAAYIVAEGPTVVQDAQTLVSVLAALTGNLTIPASVLSALSVAISDMQQFIGAVGKVSSGAVTAFAALSTYGNETPAVITNGYKLHQSVLNATAAARVALATANKK